MTTWQIIREKLSHEELVDFLLAYDNYIQDANRANHRVNEWSPNTLKEFFDNKYQSKK